MIIEVHAHAPHPGFQNQHPHWGPSYIIGDDGDQILKIGDWKLLLSTPERVAALKAGTLDSMEERDRKRRDPANRIKMMNAVGHDVQVVSMPFHYVMYHTEIEFASRFASTVNRTLAEYCAPFPDRLYFWAHVPMQSPEHVIKEIDVAVGELGAVGISGGGSNFGGLEYYSAELDPVWAKLCDYDVPIFVHGHNQSVAYGPEEAKAERYDLTTICGMPYDETCCFWNLICGGVLDRFPALKIYITHGGGFIPYHLGRLATTNAVLADVENKKPLMEYMGNFYFDPQINNPIMRRAMIDVVGADRVLYGSNFGGSDALRENLVEGLGLSDADYRKIASGNASKLLRIPERSLLPAGNVVRADAVAI
jgi:predicted TIM-barrel fold metal-dependent hydrolase